MRNICLQGNLNPEVLLKGGIQMERDIHYILESFSSLKHIFNLGHGVIKETPIENIHKLIKVIRDWEK